MTDSAWPTFIAPPLSSPRTVKSWLAAFSISSALTSSLDDAGQSLAEAERGPAGEADGQARELRVARSSSAFDVCHQTIIHDEAEHAVNRVPATSAVSTDTAGAVTSGGSPSSRCGRRTPRWCPGSAGGSPARRGSPDVADGPDDAVDLAERQRRGGQHGGPVGAADGVAQLGGDARARPRRGRCGADRRSRRQLVSPGITSGPTSPVPSRTRTGRCGTRASCRSRTTRGSATRIVRQHHQVGAARSDAGVTEAAVRDPRTRTAQRAGQQVGQRAAAVDADRRRPGAAAAPSSRPRRRPATRPARSRPPRRRRPG